MKIHHSLLFCNLLILSGRMTREQYKEFQQVQKDQSEAGISVAPMENILLERKIISTELFKEFENVRIGTERSLFGEIAVSQQLCWDQQIEEALMEQRSLRQRGTPKLLGEILVAENVIKEENIHRILALQGDLYELGGKRAEAVMAKKNEAASKGKFEAKMQVGSYLLERKLYEDELGVVFIAKDLDTHKSFNVRIFLEDGIKQMDHIKFKLNRVVKMNHSSVFHPLPIEEVDPNVFVLPVELFDGSSMKDELLSRDVFDFTAAISTISNVADVLKAIKEVGLVHGNLNIENVFITPDKGVLLYEVGLFDKMRTHPFVYLNGLNCYASPEKIFGSKIDHRSDIFSLGMILYHLVTGVPLLSGRTPFDCLLKLSIKSTPEFEQMSGDVKKRLYIIFSKMIHPQPGKRYQDYETLQADLKSLLVNTESGLDLKDSGKQQYYNFQREFIEAEEKKDREKKLLPTNRYHYFYLYKTAILSVGASFLLMFGSWFAMNYKSLFGIGGNQEAIVEPQGSYRARINFYETLLLTEKDIERREKLEMGLRNVRGQMNAAGRRHFNDLTDEIQQLMDEHDYSSTFEVLDKFDFETYYTTAWKDQVHSYKSDMEGRIQAELNKIAVKVNQYLVKKNFNAARAHVKKFENSTYGPCLVEIARLSELITVSEQKENDRIARELEAMREGSEALMKTGIQAVVMQLRNYNYEGALEQYSQHTQEIQNMIPEHQTEFSQVEQTVKQAYGVMNRLLDRSFPLCRQTEIMISTNDGPKRLVRGMREKKWVVVSGGSNKLSTISWNELNRSENHKAILAIAKVANVSFDAEVLTRLYLLTGEVTIAKDMYAICQQHGDTDADIEKKLKN